MLDDDNGGAVVHEGAEHGEKRAHVQRVQADGGLVKHENGVCLRAAHLACELEPLCLAAGKAGRFLSQREIAEPQLPQHLQPLGHKLHAGAGEQRRGNVHGHQIRQGVIPALRRADAHFAGLLAVPRTAALRAGDLHVGQELHVQADHAGPVAHGAAQAAGVVGKVACFQAKPLCVLRAGKDLAQLVVHVGVRRHGGAHVHADRRSVNELHLPDALGLSAPHVGRQRRAVRERVQRRHKAFEHERRLAGAGNTCHHGEPPLRNLHLERLHGVDRPGGEADAAQAEERFPFRLFPWPLRTAARQERPNLGSRVLKDLRDCALGNHAPASCPCLRAHLDDPVGFGQKLRVVIDEYNGVPVRHEIAHHACQPGQVGGVQADGGLVEHIEHTRGAVAHGTRQLHALPLARGEGGGGAVERKISEPQIQKAARRREK